MNKDWSEKFKVVQQQLGKEATYKEGIQNLIALRNQLFAEITDMYKNLPPQVFYAQPFVNAKGNHSTTLGWCIWHIFRIEDIVSHELIAGGQQLLFAQNYGKLIGTTCITPGNELDGPAIADFSKTLNIAALYEYAAKVKACSDGILQSLEYKDLKKRFTEEDKNRLRATNCVEPTHPDSWWLVDYWCNKNVCGLIKMPFSRHWIMHIEGMLKIKTAILKS